jgi:hypothetical protein
VELSDLTDVDFTNDGTGTISNKFCIIKNGDEGKDNVKLTQMGNQIAYELLGLGYTVLFKKLNTNESFATQLCDDNF